MRRAIGAAGVPESADCPASAEMICGGDILAGVSPGAAGRRRARPFRDDAMVVTKRLRRYIPSEDEFSYLDFPFYWLARVQGVYQQQMERALKKVGTDIPTWRVLFILKVHGKSSMSEISTHAIIKLPTLTRIMARMKAERLVETSPHAEDGRVTEVELTPEGVALIERIQAVTARLFAESYRNLSDSQITRLNATLAQIFDNLSGV